MSRTVMTRDNIEGFIRKLQSEHKSNRVIAEYRRNLDSLQVIAGDAELTKETLEKWRAGQKSQGLAPGTITNKAVRINTYLRYLGREDLCFPAGGRRNLTGKHFGNLTVLGVAERKSSDRSIYWKCRCDLCGKEKDIPANQLIRGVQKSCGCDRATRLQRTNGYVDGTCLKRVFSDKLSSNNTSGYKGVFQKRGKWTATIQYKKKTYYLGSYEKIEDAVEVRKLAEQKVREDAGRFLKIEDIKGKIVNIG